MFNNPNRYMYDVRGTDVNSWGKDSTGSITYTFDEFGFRNHNNYNKIPSYVFFGCSLLFGVGVEKNEVFTSRFNCWNFGLAGEYTESQIMDCYEEFKQTKIQSKVIFVWRDYDLIPKDILNNELVYHCLPLKSNKTNHVELLSHLDFDVSGTHWGVKTHDKFYKMLCYFLK